ncbi:MAG: hypothetical protein PHV61_05020 [Limnochordia bacterium]|nr:hypothetical protein [Limnochordia bacterium]MDD4517929.1 hypothetical protein [Limnochordia bacterium]
MLEITNENLIAVINQECGAELASLRVTTAGKQVELLYRACDYRPITGWQGRAPLLWPAVGRNFTPRQLEEIRATGDDPKLGSYTHDGNEYFMPRHGFVGQLTWRVQKVTPSSLCLVAEDDVNTRAFYPFKFTIACTYGITSKALKLRIDVSSQGDILPFSIGNHLTLALPCPYDEVVMATPGSCQLLLAPPGFLTGERKSVDYSKGLPFAQMNLDDGVIGGYNQDNCYVYLDLGGQLSLRVTQRAWSTCPNLINDDHMLFVFYASRENGFICPEPWFGRPNSFNTKQGLIMLPSGEDFSWEMGIELS